MEPIRNRLIGLGKRIEKKFPGSGYALLIFPFGDSEESNYISNANRQDMIKAMRETADRFEKQEINSHHSDEFG